MFDPNANLRDEPIVGFILLGELTTTGFFLRLMDHNTFKVMALKSTIAIEVTRLRRADLVLIAKLFVVLLPFVRITQVLDLPIL
jgi:hypothetical protein